MSNVSAKKPSRDGRFEFGGSLALNVVIFALLAISFLATWRGLRDFIIGQDAQALADPLAEGFVAAIVFVLTAAMFVALRELLRPRRWWNVPGAFIVYGLLALWSVGFGYGFWWSLIAGASATQAGLSRAVGAIEAQGADLRARIGAGSDLMSAAADLSEAKTRQEIESGGSCGVASSGGEGPLFRARMETRAQIAALARSVETDWLRPTEDRLRSLDRLATDARSIAASAPDRGARFDRLHRRAVSVARDLSADSAARSPRYATQLRAKAAQLRGQPGSDPFYCYDPDLATALEAAAQAFSEPYVIDVPPFRFAEGAEGVAVAIERLWTGVSGSISALVTGGQGPALGRVLTGRDIVALIAAMAVDLTLIVFTLLQPRRRGFSGVETRARPSAPAERELAFIISSAVQGLNGLDLAKLRACLGEAGDGRLLVVPGAGALSDPSDRANAAAIGRIAAVLNDSGDAARLSRRPSRRDRRAIARAMTLSGWPKGAEVDIDVYRLGRGLMPTLQAAVSAALQVHQPGDAARPRRATSSPGGPRAASRPGGARSGSKAIYPGQREEPPQDGEVISVLDGEEPEPEPDLAALTAPTDFEADQELRRLIEIGRLIERDGPGDPAGVLQSEVQALLRSLADQRRLSRDRADGGKEVVVTARPAPHAPGAAISIQRVVHQAPSGQVHLIQVVLSSGSQEPGDYIHQLELS